MNWIRSCLSGVYSQLSQWRVQAFQSGRFQVHKMKVPVISIGNLTFGGTGKTPVTEFLMKLLLEKGHRPGIASGAYKARKQGVKRINPRYDPAADVGDEALMLARKFIQSPVYSGKEKWRVAQTLSTQENVNVLLLDDGFQHLALARDLDIVLLDAMEKPENYECFPAGRGRESWGALERAQLIFLTKCNLAAAENLEFHRKKLAQKWRDGKTRQVFEFNYAVLGFENFKEQKASQILGKKILLVSAIAQPASFQNLMEGFFKEAGTSVQLEAFIFPDHHSFTSADGEKIRDKLKEGFDVILVTEKDFVKLKDLRTVKDLPLWQVKLGLQPDFSVEALYQKLAHVFA